MPDKHTKYKEPKKAIVIEYGVWQGMDNCIAKGTEVLVLGQCDYTFNGKPAIQYLITHPSIRHHSGHDGLDFHETPFAGRCSWANDTDVKLQG